MKIKFSSVFLFFSILFITGCTSTEIDSVKNNDVKISELKNIAVYADTPDISLRKTLETLLTKEFLKYEKNAKESIDFIPPLKKYSFDEIQFELKKNNFDGVLIFSVLKYGKEYSGSSILSNGTFLYSVPDYNFVACFDAELFELKTSTVALKATLNSESENNLDSILKSVAKKIVKEIMELEYSEILDCLKSEILENYVAIEIENKKNESLFSMQKPIFKAAVENTGVVLTFDTSIKNLTDKNDFLKFIQNDDKGSYYSATIRSKNDIQILLELLEQIVEKMKSYE